MLRRLILFIFILFFVYLCIAESRCSGADRCNDYIVDARIQHTRYFGYGYPYWYGIGQLKQESCCRSTATAFDAGQGIAQFMPATTKYVKGLMGESALDPYNPEHAIKMQAFYMSHLHRQNWDGGLWLTYQAYNGGWGNLKKEYNRAGCLVWEDMKANCKRGGVQFKWGYLSFCEVNYDYSVKIYKYGKIYKDIGVQSDNWRYW
jgi:hypothetical protein